MYNTTRNRINDELPHAIMSIETDEPITKESLRRALDEHGSVLQMAEAWDCSRQAVYYHMAKYGVPNPRTGDIPTMGQDDE